MAFTQLSKNMNIVSALSDEPNETDGMSSAQLKAKFDEGVLAIKTYINDTLLSEITAANTGFATTAGLPVSTVQAALELLYTQITSTVLGSIPAASITDAKLAADAVTTAKILDEAVTVDKIDADDWATKANVSSGKVTATQTSADVTAVTADATLAASHAGQMLDCTNSTGITLTIPTYAAASIPVDTEIEIYREGAGTVTIAAALDVTIQCSETARTIADRYTSACLKQIRENIWVLQGNVG